MVEEEIVEEEMEGLEIPYLLVSNTPKYPKLVNGAWYPCGQRPLAKVIYRSKDLVEPKPKLLHSSQHIGAKFHFLQ